MIAIKNIKKAKKQYQKIFSINSYTRPILILSLILKTTFLIKTNSRKSSYLNIYSFKYLLT